ncbi:MAG TPA: DNA polymerase IV [Acidimicrobiales bacterium]|nr:DNA polymerase IV [Acidimicrobiales bacterium]
MAEPPSTEAGPGPAEDPVAADDLVPAILHVDMDAFFASVEVLDDPSLAGKPVIVGGSGARGVVASCTYEARAFGVRSAMPSVRARQLCPQAVFIDGHHSRYADMSRQLRDVLLSTTPLVEPIGLDEAFLDVTGARRLLGTPEAIAHRIRRQVRQDLSLECSVGVGRSKMIAKLASRAAKPTAHHGGRRPGLGVVVVRPEQELAFLHPMPVQALWGVGPATAKRLADLGIRTVGDLAALDPDVLVRRLGRAHGLHLAALARAQDADPVVADRPAKSVGHEETFRDDLYDPAVLQRHAVRMAESVAGHLRGSALAGRTVTVKVKFADFTLATRSHTLPLPIDTGGAIAAVAGALLDAVDPGPGVRLLGLSVSGLQPSASTQQLAFDLGGRDAPGGAGPGGAGGTAAGGDGGTGPGGAGATAGGREAVRRQAEWAAVTAAVDAIRSRFGRASVGTVAMVGDDGIAVPARREAPWGPSADRPHDGGGTAVDPAAAGRPHEGPGERR